MPDKTISLDSIKEFAEGMPGGFFIYKAGGDEQLIYANSTMAEIFGCDSVDDFKAYVGNTFRGIVHPDDYILINHSIGVQVNTGSAGNDHVLYRIIRKDGEVRWLNDYGRLVDLEGYGKVYYVFVTDETELQNRTAGESYDRQVIGAMDSIHRALGSGDWGMSFDQTGEMTSCSWSQRFREMLGYSSLKDFPDALESWADLLVPEDRDRVLNHYWDVVRDYSGRKTYDTYYRLKTKNKGIRWFRAIGSLTRREDGTPISFYGIFLDVDENMRIREEEKTSTDNIIGALSSVYTYVYAVNMTRGTAIPVRLDRRLSELKGDDYTGEHPFNLGVYAAENVHPDDRHLFEPVETVEKCRKLFEKRNRYSIPYRVIINGEVHYLELELVKASESTDEFIEAFKVVDEQERVKQEQAKREREQLGIIDALASEYKDLFLVNAATHRFRVLRVASKAQSVMEEQDDSEVVLRDYTDKFVIPEDREAMYAACDISTLNELVPETGIYSITYRRKLDDEIRHFQLNIARFTSDDGTDYYVHGFRDITDSVQREIQIQKALRQAYDAAESASHAKSDFLQTMSHDIRTPMNGIIGMTAIAAAHIDDKERVQDSLRKITVASKHLLSLINEVLDMSKIESGKLTLSEEEFNLSELVDNMLAMVRQQISDHNHDLIVNIREVEHEQVIGDPLRVQQVFMNLMGNAIKYTPNGGKIRLNIREIPCNQLKTGCFEFTFEDNGIGMSEEYLQHIFEPFTRAEDGKVNKIQGTGLGMPIAKNIVNMMGGDIKVTSVLGEGSKFVVTIFLKLQDQLEVDYEKFINLPVLVADDDELSMESAVDMLIELGMQAEGVLSGEEAVDRVSRRHEESCDYHAVVLDWKMPGMDGVATARAIRAEVGNDIPIIILSAYDWTDIEDEARAAGVNAFVSKPLFKSRLARLFSEVLGDGGDDRKSDDDSLDSILNMDLHGFRCLLVEDNELNAEIATELLTETGLEVQHANDGAEAVDLMTNAPDGEYDIILMDIQMPKMNGYDATRAIRAMDRAYCKAVPIVAMTANAFAEDVITARNAGMNDHIAKPIELDVLAKVLNKYLLKK